MTITHLALPQEQYEEVKRELRHKKRFFIRFSDGDSATFYKEKNVIMAKKPDGTLRIAMSVNTTDVINDFQPSSQKGHFVQECVANGIPLHTAIFLYDTLIQKT